MHKTERKKTVEQQIQKKQSNLSTLTNLDCSFQYRQSSVMFLRDMEQRVRALDQLELCRRRYVCDVEIHVNSVNCSPSTPTNRTTLLSL